MSNNSLLFSTSTIMNCTSSLHWIVSKKGRPYSGMDFQLFARFLFAH